MKNALLLNLLLSAFFALALFTGCSRINNTVNFEEYRYDNADLAAQFEFDRTKDPVTGKIPAGQLMKALLYTDSLKKIAPIQMVSGFGVWTERGPNSDATGPSNGNTRANSGVASGRIRAIWVDLADATGKTVWVGGVAGGLWETTDITASPATWNVANDYLSNLAISSICQDPITNNTMYFCTGESFFNLDAVRGNGIFKSTDHGVTWTQLSATTGSNYNYCSKILCDAVGNVYVTTGTGVYRSTNGGTSFTDITPTGLTANGFSDMEISKTGRLHVSAGIFATCAYRFTDIPATVAAGTWTSPTSGYPSSSIRIELGCSGSVLYALPSDGTYQVPTIYKSTDGGANWAATAAQPTSGWASGQAWYALAIDIDSSNTNNVIVGGLNPYKTTNGGTSWTQLADWTNNAGLPPVTTQYVHADIHNIKIYSGTKVLFACDGGIHYSSDGGTTIRDRNVGLRIKQFYSVAIHPSTTNYFLGGAQDNGCHQFSVAGLGATVEVTGGDGAFVKIDQKAPANQFGSYVYNEYRRSTNSGASWTPINFSLNGQFINPIDFDTVSNMMFCGNTAGTFLRWSNPLTGSTNTSISITALNGNSVTAITVSPYTAKRVYFGTKNDGGATSLCYVDNADVAISGTAGTNISTGLPTNVYTSCLAEGTSDQNLMVCYSNYGVQQVWVSTNGGTSWTNIDGDLPDMPVRWCMFIPGANTGAIIATEAGVYFTTLINGASTAWLPSPTFPTVRTDMLQYRPADKIIAAATHGRGLWTQPYYSIVPTNNFLLRGKWNGNQVELNWQFDGVSTGTVMDIEVSPDAVHYEKVGSITGTGTSAYAFNYSPNQQNLFYRIRSTETSGLQLFSNTIRLFKTGSDNNTVINKLYPNPVQQILNAAFSISQKGTAQYSIISMSGQTVWRKEEDLQYIGAYQKNWTLAGMRPGTYVFSISLGGKKQSQQFIKQ